jgi:hypothetical protein
MMKVFLDTPTVPYSGMGNGSAVAQLACPRVDRQPVLQI